MKRQLLTLAFLLCIAFNSTARDFHFSSSLGDDSRSANDAQSPNTPWKSLEKLNSFLQFGDRQAGDRFLFKCGETFNGTIKVFDGPERRPTNLFFGSYGSGPRPIINGLVTIGNWVEIGENSGIYEGSVVSGGTPGSGGNVLSNLTYKYYEGSWTQLPDFGGLTPIETGTASNFDISLRDRDENFGFLFEGKINIPQPGSYYFETSSDDGSRLYIGDWGHYVTPVVDNDGQHAAQTRGGWHTFSAAGQYKIAVSFFENGGDQQLKVFWGNPNAGIPMHTEIPSISSGSSSGNSGISSLTLGPTVSMVLLNDIPQQMGRYPNNSYINNTSNNAKFLTGNDPLDNKIWVGGEAVVRVNREQIKRSAIKTQNGNTIEILHEYGQNNFGFFIQNHPQTLDYPGEWYYDSENQKLRVYFGSESPGSYVVKAGALKNLAEVYSSTNVLFDNLSFQGTYGDAVRMQDSDYITVTNCEFKYAGVDGLYAGNISHFTLQNSSFNYCNNNGFKGFIIPNTIIRDNNLQNIGIFQGHGTYENGATHTGITVANEYEGAVYKNALIEGNQLFNIGYNGIDYFGDELIIQKNLVDNFCFVKDDGGGIYLNNATQTYIPNNESRKILDNIIMNGIGAPAGTNSPNYRPAYGIYLDDNNDDVEVARNTAFNCGESGFYIHRSKNIIMHHNTSFNNTVTQLKIRDDKNDVTISGLTITNNIFFAKYPYQWVSSMETPNKDKSSISTWGQFDLNYYCRPILETDPIRYTALDNNNDYYESPINLAGWKSIFNKDLNSNVSPRSVSSESEIFFDYNYSNTEKTIQLSGNYVDVRNNPYSGSVKIPAYSSIILLAAGTQSVRRADVMTSTPNNYTLRIAPNPTANELQFIINDNSLLNKKALITIQSVNGGLVKRLSTSLSPVTVIGLSGLSAGSYLVTINCDNRQLTGKFIKQ